MSEADEILQALRRERSRLTSGSLAMHEFDARHAALEPWKAILFIVLFFRGADDD